MRNRRALAVDAAWGYPAAVALVVLALAAPALAGRVFLLRDLHFFVPQQTFAARALAAGRLPEWNPALYGGMPFFAEPGAGVLYPGNLLHHAIGGAAGETAFALVHVALAAAGAWALARALGLAREGAAFSAVAYAASGYVLAMHWAHYYVASAAWIPLAAALLVRAADAPSAARIGAAAGALGLFALDGEPQGVLFAGALGLVLAALPPQAPHPSPTDDAANGASGAAGGASGAAGGASGAARRAAVVAIAGGLGAALAAVQLIPTWLALRDTTRAAGVAYTQSASWSLHPARWLELVAPQPFGALVPDNTYWATLFLDGWKTPWATSLYLGPAVLAPALAALGRAVPARVRAAAALAPIGLALAAGDHLPFYRAYHALVPFAARFRYPEKLAVLATLGLALLAGHAIERRAELARRTTAWAAILGGALLAASGAVALGADALRPHVARGLTLALSGVSPDEALANLRGTLVRAALVAGGVALAARLGRSRPHLAAPLLVGLACVDLTSAGLRALSYGEAPFFADEPAILADVRAHTPPGSAGRVFRDPECVYRGGGEGSQVERVRAWEWHTGKENYLALAGVNAAIGYHAVEPAARQRAFDAVRLARGPLEALRLFGAATLIRCDARGPRVVPVKAPLPRAAVLPAEVAEDPTLSLRVPTFDFAARAALAPEDARAASPASTPAPARVTDVSPEEVMVRAEGAGLCVLFDAYAPGWSATVDGAPAPVVAADGIFRAVAVPGPSTVVFRYRTPGLAAGAAVTATAALALLAALAASARRRHAEGVARPAVPRR